MPASKIERYEAIKIRGLFMRERNQIRQIDLGAVSWPLFMFDDDDDDDDICLSQVFTF